MACTVLALKIRHLSSSNISSLEAIRAEMDKNIEGDEYLDYSERRRNFRAVSLDTLLAQMAGLRQLTKNLVVGKKLITGRTSLQ